MSFASISCCRGPTKADKESANRPGTTAERIGSRGIRPRQELATASIVRPRPRPRPRSREALPADATGNAPPELPPAWIGQIRVPTYGFTSQAGAVGRPALGSGIRPEAPLAPSQPRDVRSAGRDTWNLTGEALGGPRKR